MGDNFLRGATHPTLEAGPEEKNCFGPEFPPRVIIPLTVTNADARSAAVANLLVNL